jgi:hypothetical protein
MRGIHVAVIFRLPDDGLWVAGMQDPPLLAHPRVGVEEVVVERVALGIDYPLPVKRKDPVCASPAFGLTRAFHLLPIVRLVQVMAVNQPTSQHLTSAGQYTVAIHAHVHMHSTNDWATVLQQKLPRSHTQ